MNARLTDEHLKQEVTVCLPLAAVLQLGAMPAIQLRTMDRVVDYPLSIGSAGPDGQLYAGLSIDENGKPCELWLLPDAAEEVTWEHAKDFVTKVGGLLPSRFDALVLFKNLPGEFEKDAYWTSEEYAHGAGDAWYQGFSTGFQSYWRKSYKDRARAVRRLPI